MVSIIHRREKIIYRAIELINESGVQALSTKRLAQIEKIAESTIFKHFPSKNDILLAVLEFYSQYDDDMVESIRVKGLTGIEALFFYSESYIKYYENYPEITAITQGLDEMRYIEPLSEKVRDVIGKRRQCLRTIVDEAKRIGELSSKFDTETYVDAILGSVNGVIRRWRMEAYGFPLHETCMEVIKLIIKEN